MAFIIQPSLDAFLHFIRTECPPEVAEAILAAAEARLAAITQDVEASGGSLGATRLEATLEKVVEELQP